MTNPFITIWAVIKRMAKSLEAKSWQMILLSTGLIYMVWSFICIHQIRRTELSYHVNEILGLTQNGKSELKIDINNGLLFEHDSIPRDWLIIDASYDTTYNHRFRQNIQFHKVDSTFDAIAPDLTLDRIVHLYQATVCINNFSRAFNHELVPQYEIPQIDFSKNRLWAVLNPPSSEKRQYRLFNNLFTDTSIGYFGGLNCDELSYSLFRSSEGINTYPSIWEPWDISQKSYKLQYTTDSDPASTIYAKGKPIPDNKLLPLGNLKVDFMGPVELLPMSPEPDIVSMSGFEFTDSLKLQQIMRDGLEFHAKFPQTESLQSARIFFLTTFISLFFTLLCTLSYRLIRYRYRHWNYSKGKKSEVATPTDCNE